MTVRLIHIASSYQIGLTNQETQLALAYRSQDELELLVVTGEKEQYQGCFSQLERNGVSFEIIKGFDDHSELKRLVNDFAATAEKFYPAIVTVNTNWQLLVAGLARRRSGLPYKIVYTIHGFRHNQKLKSLIARYLIGALLWIYADRIIAPSSYVAEKFSFHKKRIVQIPLGEDKVFFEQSTSPDFSQSINYCFPGEFRFGKNQALLVDAFIEFINITGNKSSNLYLPGIGELRQDLIQQVNNRGFSGRIHFPGQLDRAGILNLYNRCQVAVIPSNDETFGHCIAEPLVLQRIVVSRPVGVALDYIVDKSNGFIFNTKDDLVKVLLHIDTLGVAALANISRAAKETGYEFNWHNVARKIIDKVFAPLAWECPGP